MAVNQALRMWINFDNDEVNFVGPFLLITGITYAFFPEFIVKTGAQFSAFARRPNFDRDKNILITGGTGSFGKACAHYLLEKNLCNKVIIFSRDE